MRSRCVVSVGVAAVLLAVAAFGQSTVSRQVVGAPPAEAAGQERIACTGKVTDSQARPVQGAKVTLHQLDVDSSEEVMTAQRIGEKVTGADGAFAFTAAKPSGIERLGCLLVQKEGFALGWGVWPMREGSRPADIVLGKPKELTGVVVDEAGTPVDAADVSIAVGLIGSMEDQRFMTFMADPQLLTVKTDARGRFVFANMPAEATFDFFIKRPGRATICTFNPSTEKCQFAIGQPDIKLTLPPEATIQGVVVEKAGGKPVAGVPIIARQVGQEVPFGNDPIVSGPDGTFRLTGLAAGDYRVRVRPRDREPAPWVAEPVQVSLQTGQTQSEVQLQLEKGCTIEVLVKDSAGKPAAGANVHVYSPQTEQRFHGATDENGLARLRVTPGQYVLTGVYSEGHARQGMTQQQSVAVADGQTRRLEHVLTAAPKVTGIVRDEAGKPLEGVQLELKPMGGPSQRATDAEGRFEVTWDPRMFGPSGVTPVLVVRDEARNLVQVVELEEQTKELDLKLSPGLIVTGTVQNEQGQALSGARVRVMMIVARYGSGLGRGDLATTGADGKFELRAIPLEHQCIVSAQADGYGKRDIPVNPGAAQGDRFDAGVFKLAVANLSVSGVVVDADDQPVAGARIYAYGEGQPDSGDIQTDAEGKFTIKSVCPGTVRLHAHTSRPPFQSGSAQVEAGATDVHVVISARSSAQPYGVRKPSSLKGKPLPSLRDLGVELPADTQGKMLLVCFFDMNQRPSRYCLTQLTAQAAALAGKAVTVVAIQAAKTEDTTLREWTEKNKIPFPVGHITSDEDKMRFAWGAASLPHLILTDKSRTVVAEGFSPGDLDKHIEMMAGR